MNEISEFLLFSRSTQARPPNYSYLADGTKISALNGGCEGLVYRGPFVYRRSTRGGTSSLTLESAAFGGFLTKVGAAETAFGGAALAAGATSVSVSGGTLVFVGGLVSAVGAEELVKGVVTAAGGSLMMMNSSKNQLDGYERGKTNVSSGNKNSQHANLKAKLAAKEKYEDTRLRYQEIKSKNQKTPEDRKLENVLKRHLDYWKRKMDFTGENHSQGGGKGNKK